VSFGFRGVWSLKLKELDWIFDLNTENLTIQNMKKKKKKKNRRESLDLHRLPVRPGQAGPGNELISPPKQSHPWTCLTLE
jgi:hypothetical protein